MNDTLKLILTVQLPRSFETFEIPFEADPYVTECFQPLHKNHDCHFDLEAVAIGQARLRERSELVRHFSGLLARKLTDLLESKDPCKGVLK
ncbi:MAG: hypothetical protein V3V47_01890 [Desulfobacteria bacterium]